MADITMCDNPTCPVRQQCARHEASGTKPCQYRQSYFADEQRYGSKGCDYFTPSWREASAA